MDYLSKHAREISPYTAGEQPKDKKYIKLNTNENAFVPPDAVSDILKNFDTDSLKLYPDPESSGLTRAIAAAEDVSHKNIFVGNGSDEILALIFPTFFDVGGGGAAFNDVTYSFYKVYCSMFSVKQNIIKSDENYKTDIEKFINLKGPQGIIIANPNAPTGEGLPLSTIERIVSSNLDKIVIVDEAYMDFFNSSGVVLTKKYKNLLVVKTFSKGYSLAGIRCGYAVGDSALIYGLNKIKNSFNSYPLDRICQAVCESAIKNSGYFKEKNQIIIAEREKLQAFLKAQGFLNLESKANFIMAGFKGGGELIYRELKERGILVRYFDTERLSDYVRITIGQPSENKKLMNALAEIYKIYFNSRK